MKTCSKCGIEKNDSDFYKANLRPDGLQHWCKQCVKSYEQRPENKTRRSDKQKKWRKEKPEISRQYRQDRKDKGQCSDCNNPSRPGKTRCTSCALHRRIYVLLKKGLHSEESIKIEQAVAEFTGCCPVCGTENPGGMGEWNIDHCHATNRFRGILCSACNNALGFINDNSDTLRKLAKYIDDFNSQTSVV
jgi:hypothetical protein